MAKDFKALVRLNDWAVDGKRRALAEQLRQLDNLEGRLKALEEEMIREREAATAMPTEAGLTYAAYASHALDRKRALQAQIREQIGAVETAREELRLAYLEFKKYDIAENRRAAMVEAELAKADQAVLDEIGINIHRRKT
jgi:flagellar export protein FliJ